MIGLTAGCCIEKKIGRPINERHVTNDLPLFVHLILPTLYFENHTQASVRVVTTQVRPSEPFSVIVGQDLETLSGIVERRGGRFHAEIRANCYGTGNRFNGDVDAEKPIRFTDALFSGYIVLGNFVISTNEDCKAFLNRQPEEDQAALKIIQHH